MKIKLLESFPQIDEEFVLGAIVCVDEPLAERWCRLGLAEAIGAIEETDSEHEEPSEERLA